MREQIKALISSINVSQAEFASSIEMTPQALSNYMQGRTKELSIDVLKDLKSKYNVNPLWLLTGEGEMFLNEQRQIQVQDAKRMIQEQMQARLRERENPKLAKLIEKLGLLNEENLASVTGYVDALLEKEKKHG